MPSWNVKDEDMADISDWTDSDEGTAASTQETFDSRSCMKMVSTVSNSAAVRGIVSGTAFTNFTCDVVFYIDQDNYSGGSGLGLFMMQWRTSDSKLVRLFINSDNNQFKLRIATPTDYVYTDLSVPEDTWNTVRTVCEDQKISLYLNGLLYLCEYPNTATTVNTPNTYHIRTEEGIVYVDSYKLSSTAEHIATSPLAIGSNKIVVRYRQRTDNAAYPNGVEALSTYGGTNLGSNPQVLSIPLVTTTHGNASTVRIYDGSATKSLMKLPS